MGFATLLLAAASTAVALVIRDGNVVPISQDEVTYGHAPHHADHAAVLLAESGDSANVDQTCFHFTADNEDWSFTTQNPWGDYSERFGNLNNGQLCVATNDSAGGAMFIGPSSNPGPGDTKLECFFPRSSNTGNCDISLVDGYSLSVSCTAAGNSNTIGGGVDLWTQGNSCPDQQGDFCRNDNGYAASQSDVAQFFQPAVNNGNNYCIWVNCGQDYYFPTSSTVNCHISGTAE